MNEDVLLKFISKRLINVGGDDNKLEHLRRAAADLADILEETPANACPFALVAFDPEVPASDPTIIAVEEALSKRWQTYRNTFSDTPVAVFRAMLLDALVSACGRNDTVAAAFVACARNVLPLMEVGVEQELWADIVANIEKKVEDRSEKEWATPASISVPNIKFKSTFEAEAHIAPKKVTASRLEPKFKAVVAPSVIDPQGMRRNTGGNPHWLQNDPENWAYEFGTRTAKLVAETINSAIGGLSVEGLNLPGYTEEIAEVISEHTKTTLQAVGSASAGLQRRTNLLWWKEALFSPSARMSYRDMTSCDAAVLMAFDMHQQIPTFSPASAAAFLRETIVSLPTVHPEETSSIRELVEKTRDADILSELRTEAANLVGAPAGRCSVLAIIGHSDSMTRLDGFDFRDRIGVKPETALTLPDWSVWVFRELQAARAVAEASKPKRRPSRKRTPRK